MTDADDRETATLNTTQATLRMKLHAVMMLLHITAAQFKPTLPQGQHTSSEPQIHTPEGWRYIRYDVSLFIAVSLYRDVSDVSDVSR